jgi:hypothetical protein
MLPLDDKLLVKTLWTPVDSFLGSDCLVPLELRASIVKVLMLFLAMEFALKQPEILQMIFDYADQPSRATAALVCQKWSNIALSSLWKSLDSIEPILLLYEN